MPPSRKAKTTLDKGDYLFFWKTTHVNGWASQWYPASFEATLEMDEGVMETIRFPTAEHWMMTQKALLFSDKAVARKVIEADGSNMRHVKSLGRQVENFNEERWAKERGRIVLEGNMLKFGQNADLREKLMQTGEKIIVEASPMDKIWGIGMGESKALSTNQSKWGLNLLGKALMETREKLK